MTTTRSLIASAWMLAGAAAVMAGTPWGRDDTGFLPPDAPNGPITKCENGLGKGAGKLAVAQLKCHASRATGKLASDGVEDFCESQALAKFGHTEIDNCPCVFRVSLANALGSFLESENGVIYCAPGTPFGGDDAGNMPSDAPSGPITKCENRIGKALGKAFVGLFKCHASRAAGKVDETGEEACESAVLQKLLAAKTDGCTGCIDKTALAADAENQVDSALNGYVYCASPGGAFLD